MSSSPLKNWFDQFNNLKALVVGDVMIDAYYWGEVNRISPEAPVPIAQISSHENRLGGAANVALNVMSLGATPIIASVIGEDEKGKLFKELLQKRQFTDVGVLQSGNRKTTVKTRIIADGQHLLRVDEEDLSPLSNEDELLFIENCRTILNSGEIDVVIFEDYDKGVLTPKVIKELVDIAIAKNIPTTVDPKKDHFFNYQGVSLFKPNLKELREGLKREVNPANEKSLMDAIAALESHLQNKWSLITLSEHGVAIKAGEEWHQIPAHPREIADVSGAGDTVISVASLLLAVGADPKNVASIANLSGGLV
ncbi:MAG: PfkB family carbohydrate kinase, partial [Bacteroidota bacterium]